MSNQSCIRLYADRKKIDACKERLAAEASPIQQLSNVLALAGNEVRLKIMFLLHEEPELCPCDLSDILGMSVPAVSQHLRKMKDGNIIASRRDGQTLYYALTAQHLGLLKIIFNQLDTTKKEEVV
jgi:DNA-binding transcriptional ArsR family regulator